MPCRDYQDVPPPSSSPRYRAEIKRLKARNDKYARMLCFVLTNVPANAIAALKNIKSSEHSLAGSKVSPHAELMEWWTAHQAADAAEAQRKARIKREAKAAELAAKQAEEDRQTALRKLSAKDKKALGLK